MTVEEKGRDRMPQPEQFIADHPFVVVLAVVLVITAALVIR